MRRLTVGSLLIFLALPLAGLPGQAAAAESSSGADEANAPEAGDPPGELRWLSYAPAAFRRAQHDNRLILLVLDMPWSERSRQARERLWGHPKLVKLIDEAFVAVRERADLRPGLVRRHPAPGLPAMSLLLPDGTPLVFSREGAGGAPVAFSSLDPQRVIDALTEADTYYREKGAEAVQESRKKLAEAGTKALPTRGKTDPSVAPAVASALEGQYDPQRRYFGGAPRVPRLEALDLLGRMAAEDPDRWGSMFEGALSQMVAGLTDPEDGGLHSLARGLDWEDPEPVKLLSINAAALELLSVARARVPDTKSFAAPAGRLAGFLIETLGREGGGFATALAPACPGGRCDTVISGETARAAAALIRAGDAFEEKAWKARGLEAARFVRKARYGQRRGIVRGVVDGFAVPPGTIVLDDLAASTWAFLAAYDATGERAWLAAAEDLAGTAVRNLAHGKSGVLADMLVSPTGPAALRQARFPVIENARMARALMRLAGAAEDGAVYRRAAERILGGFAGSEPQMKEPERAAYALAVLELATRGDKDEKEK